MKTTSFIGIEAAAKLAKKSPKTIRRWRDDMLEKSADNKKYFEQVQKKGRKIWVLDEALVREHFNVESTSEQGSVAAGDATVVSELNRTIAILQEDVKARREENADLREQLKNQQKFAAQFGTMAQQLQDKLLALPLVQEDTQQTSEQGSEESVVDVPSEVVEVDVDSEANESVEAKPKSTPKKSSKKAKQKSWWDRLRTAL